MAASQGPFPQRGVAHERLRLIAAPDCSDRPIDPACSEWQRWGERVLGMLVASVVPLGERKRSDCDESPISEPR